MRKIIRRRIGKKLEKNNLWVNYLQIKKKKKILEKSFGKCKSKVIMAAEL